jgi:hypothetical protein
MNKRILTALAAVGTVAITAIAEPASAQIDWIGIKIDNDRVWASQRRNAIRKRNKNTRTQPSARKPAPKLVVSYPEVQVNGQKLQSPVAPVQRGKTTFVPFREIFEALGATVSYNDQHRLITATRGTSQMQLSLPGGNKQKMQGRRRSFDDDEMPFIHQGTTMIPLRMVSEKMGAEVGYIPRPTTSLISITSKAAGTP